MFEHRSEALVSQSVFMRRVVRHSAIAGGVIVGSLAIGILGYHAFEDLPWIDSLLNAAMILGGMGQVNELHTDAGKIFAAFFALYSGVIFLIAAGLIFAPVFHRFLHRFHLETDDNSASDNRGS